MVAGRRADQVVAEDRDQKLAPALPVVEARSCQRARVSAVSKPRPPPAQAVKVSCGLGAFGGAPPCLYLRACWRQRACCGRPTQAHASESCAGGRVPFARAHTRVCVCVYAWCECVYVRERLCVCALACDCTRARPLDSPASRKCTEGTVSSE